jgi:hypothetical protein
MLEFKIIRSGEIDPVSFENRVNQAFNEGWLPVGGVHCFVKTSGGDVYPTIREMPLYRKKPEPPKPDPMEWLGRKLGLFLWSLDSAKGACQTKSAEVKK